MPAFDRVIWIVLDSVGIGELPDAADYGDVGRNTLGHIARSRPLRAAESRAPGPRQYRAARSSCRRPPRPRAASAKAPRIRPARTPRRATGKWRASGCRRRFPVYKHGFPRELIEQFERAIGRKTLGNKPASGTEIIKELGEEHVRTGFPDRVHVRRQRLPDRRARRRDPHRRALSHVRDRAQDAGRPASRRPRHRPAFHRHAGKFPAHRAPPRLRRRAAAPDAARRAGRARRSRVRRRQDSRHLQRARSRRITSPRRTTPTAWRNCTRSWRDRIAA